jgi:hypothetical protein
MNGQNAEHESEKKRDLAPAQISPQTTEMSLRSHRG